MANHFCIATKSKRVKGFPLRLHGDFDGSSAWELRQVIQHIAGRCERVAVETGRHPNANRFGLEVIAAHRPPNGRAAPKWFLPVLSSRPLTWRDLRHPLCSGRSGKARQAKPLGEDCV